MSEHQCRSQCHGNCDGCHESELNGCPLCGRIGLDVAFETVYSLTNPLLKEQLKNLKDSRFYLCTQRPCKVAYYTENKEKIMINQINVPIWFKHHKDEYIVCYCRRIILSDILEAVNHLEIVTKENIIEYLNKEDVITDCLHNNPTGSCCDKLFENAITYALKQKDVSK
ncbi:MAG: BFD-like (2Fe-2S) protein [Haloplasmataceae bacterium]|nr:BFD-like (2Fe-2S) protein [Haloplasmataceae bacterium]